MALYRLEAKIISRKNRGRSVIGSAAYRSASTLYKAAYRSGNELKAERASDAINYRPRAQEVVYTEILAPKDGPTWLQAEPPKTKEDMHRQRPIRQRLWSTIERVEKRKDSRLAREFVLALARELSLEQQIELVRDWCQTEFISKGLVVDFAMHKSKLGNNPHAHVLVTTRPVEGQGFGKKPSTAGHFNRRNVVGLKGKSELLAWRDSWAKHENAALEKAGRPERVDHRSLKARGIDREPEPKIGVEAMAMMRRGLDPERFKLWRYVRALNEMRPFARAIERFGEIHQEGVGNNWWERSVIFMNHARQAVRETVKDSWRMMLDAHGRSSQHLASSRDGPDMSR